MYAYIDTNGALEVLRLFLEKTDREGKLQSDFGIEMILQAVSLILEWNLFEFDATFFKHLLATAMGNSIAFI